MDRLDAEEIIDNPNTPPEIIRATLRDQAVVNRVLGGGSATWKHVLIILPFLSADPVRILDIGCGGGDISRRIADEARRMGKTIEITAMDANPVIVDIARELSAGYPEITLVRGDALDVPFGPGTFDIVMMATLLHHFPPDRAVAALREARRVSGNVVIVSDLVRSRLAYCGILFFARLTGFHEVSRHDGAISVRRAYTPRELAAMADEAGLEDWHVFHHRLYRMTLVYRGTGATEAQ